MTFVLEAGGPLNADATLARYRIWGADPVNRLADGAFARVVRLGEALIPYEVRFSGPVDEARLHVRVDADPSSAVRDVVSGEVRKLFGLDFDLPAFYRFARGEPVLEQLIEPHYGLRPTLTPAPLEILVASITAQQINLSFAFACRARLVRGYGVPIAVGSGSVYAFPTATVLSQVSVSDLRALKYSSRKAEYIRDLARTIASEELDCEALAVAPNAEVVARLTALRGLGRWTAEWFLARGLGRGDVCPAGDLAVRKAFEHYFGNGAPLSEEEVRRRAEGWGPHQNLAVHYLLAAHRSS